MKGGRVDTISVFEQPPSKLEFALNAYEIFRLLDN